MPQLSTAQFPHARYYATVAQAIEAQRRSDLAHALATFDAERDQIDGGWACAEHNQGAPDGDELLLRFANGTAGLSDLRYQAQERLARYTAGVAAAQRQAHPHMHGVMLANLALAQSALGRMHEAIPTYEQAQALLRHHGS